MRLKSFMLVSIAILFMSLVQAQEITVYNDCEIYGICVPDVTVIQNITTNGSVNSSEFWLTNIGALGDVNSSQFSNEGGFLTAILSFWDGFYCQLSGCTMTGGIEMSGNNISNVGNISMNGEIISQNPTEGVNLWVLNSTNEDAVSIIASMSNVDSFVSLVSIGSSATPPETPFTKSGGSVGALQNDSGIYCSGGRCFMINNGQEDIVFGHIALGDNNLRFFVGFLVI